MLLSRPRRKARKILEAKEEERVGRHHLGENVGRSANHQFA